MPCTSGARCRVAYKNTFFSSVSPLVTELLLRIPTRAPERRTARATNAMFGTFDSDDDDGPIVLYVHTRDCAGGNVILTKTPIVALTSACHALAQRRRRVRRLTSVRVRDANHQAFASMLRNG